MTFTSEGNQLIRSICQLCASHTGKPGFFERFRFLARQFEGIDEVIMIDAGRESAAGIRPGKVYTSAPIRVMGEVVGRLQVYIRVRAFRDSTPLPLTNFLGRQLESALRGSAIHVSHSVLTNQLAVLESEVQEHKLIERARGFIESKRLIPTGHGARLLEKVSRQSGKNLQELARGILTAAEKSPWRFRKQHFA